MSIYDTSTGDFVMQSLLLPVPDSPQEAQAEEKGADDVTEAPDEGPGVGQVRTVRANHPDSHHPFAQGLSAFGGEKGKVEEEQDSGKTHGNIHAQSTTSGTSAEFVGEPNDVGHDAQDDPVQSERKEPAEKTCQLRVGRRNRLREASSHPCLP